MDNAANFLINSGLNEIVVKALSIIILAIAAAFGELIRRKIGAEKLTNIQRTFWAKKDLVDTGIRFVEAFYKEIHGPDKYKKAQEWIVAQGAKVGLIFTEDELQGLIEAAVGQLNLFKNQNQTGEGLPGE